MEICMEGGTKDMKVYLEFPDDVMKDTLLEKEVKNILNASLEEQLESLLNDKT